MWDGGINASIKICKGVRYRFGQVETKTETKEVLEVDDSGYFYLTNQNVGFKGQRKHFSIAYSKISSLELTEYGLVIFKKGKESPYIITLEDYEVPLAIISYMINNQ